MELGCGIGRHAQALASEGFECVGIDASPHGIAEARRNAEAAGLSIDYREGPLPPLPFESSSFELVIAWNVVYHGDGESIGRALDEVRRVLAPGGLYVSTMLSKRNAQFGIGTEVRPDTFVVEGASDDKAHPHFYCDATTLLQLHHGFEVLQLRDREQRPGAFHWEAVFEYL